MTGEPPVAAGGCHANVTDVQLTLIAPRPPGMEGAVAAVVATAGVDQKLRPSYQREGGGGHWVRWSGEVSKHMHKGLPVYLAVCRQVKRGMTVPNRSSTDTEYVCSKKSTGELQSCASSSALTMLSACSLKRNGSPLCDGK